MKRPLEGKSILITRTREQSGALGRRLQDAGARVFSIPTISIRPRPPEAIDPFVRQMAAFDWLLLTSVNGAKIFLGRALELDCLPPVPPPRIAAIGPATASCIAHFGRKVDLLPALYQAEGVIEELTRRQKGNLEGLRILLPRAGEAREILPLELGRLGAAVEVVPVYDTVLPLENRPLLNRVLDRESPDLIVFTSPSTVRNFIELAGNRPDVDRFACAVIGPITRASAVQYGLSVCLEARPSTVPDLVRTIEAHFQRER